MKTLILGLTLLSTTAFAAIDKSTTTNSAASTKASKATTSTANKTATLTTASKASSYAAKANPQIHFSANMLGLINGKPNVNANFFVMPKIALSFMFSNESEKTTPIKKANFAAGTKLTLSTTQFGVGAAYYFFPMEQKWNVLANPFLVTEKKSDPIDTENNLGAGLKADAVYLINSLALGAGLQATSISGNTNTIINAGVGYMF